MSLSTNPHYQSLIGSKTRTITVKNSPKVQDFIIRPSSFCTKLDSMRNTLRTLDSCKTSPTTISYVSTQSFHQSTPYSPQRTTTANYNPLYERFSELSKTIRGSISTNESFSSPFKPAKLAPPSAEPTVTFPEEPPRFPTPPSTDDVNDNWEITSNAATIDTIETRPSIDFDVDIKPVKKSKNTVGTTKTSRVVTNTSKQLNNTSKNKLNTSTKKHTTMTKTFKSKTKTDTKRATLQPPLINSLCRVQKGGLANKLKAARQSFAVVDDYDDAFEAVVSRDSDPWITSCLQ
ncbi:hypothetical protein RCL1_001137 [Eukaryota sp. TZLM3-RCL]